MKKADIIDAIGELPEEMIAPVANLRRKKPVRWIWWVTAAACLCLALLPLAWQGVSMDSLYSEMEHAERYPAQFQETGDEEYGGLTDNASQARFRAEVLMVDDYGILVRPLEGEQELNCSDKIEVSFYTVKNIPQINVGDTVEIIYSGMIQETYPARVTDATEIRVIE